MKESEAQAAILDYLALRGVFAIRLNNQPIYDPKRGIFRSLPKHTPKGLADILAIKNGRTVFVEVKGEKGRLSDDQLEFQKRCILADVEYVVAKGIEDVQTAGL
jgi:hypothetical protein